MADPVARSLGASVRARLALVLPVSLAIHGILLLLSPGPPDEQTELLRTLSCPALCEHRLHDNWVWFEAEPAPVAELTSVEAEPEPEPEAEPEEEEEEAEPVELEPVPENAYFVHLPNDEEVEAPEDAEYVAEDNNRTDVEVQAAITTREEAAAGDPREGESVPESTESDAAGEDESTAAGPEEEDRLALAEDASGRPGGEVVDMAAMARASAGSTPIVGANPNSPSAPDSGEGLDLSPFQPRLEEYRTSQLAAEDLGERERISREVRRDGFLGGDDEAEWERTRAALENMVPEVRSGTETRLNTRRHAYAEWLSHVHRRIHERWAEDYLVRLDLDFDPLDPLSNPDLEAVLELVIDREGEVVRVNIVRTSGITAFDGEAIGVGFDIGPVRPPPAAILSDNGNAYIHWTFWRDQRQCGPFGASVHRLR